LPLGLDLHRSKLILAITLASIIAIDFITLPAPKSILIKAVPNITSAHRKNLFPFLNHIGT